MKSWLELAVTVPAEAADAVANRLIEGGSPGVIEDEAPSGPQTLRIRAHFPEPVDSVSLADGLRSFLGSLESFFPGCAAASIEVASVAEEDWAEGWKQRFPPIEAGRRLRIRTPWWPPGADDRAEVVIEPAMAFGTGQHPSTLGCLVALEDLFAAKGPLSPVLDLGTGSAILAIAAARLGAKEVLGLDSDPLAVEAALANVRRNGLVETVLVREGTIESAGGRFPLILANLYGGALRALAPALARSSSGGGWLIVSGLLEAEVEPVAEALSDAGWSVAAARPIEGWTTLVLENRCPASS